MQGSFQRKRPALVNCAAIAAMPMQTLQRPQIGSVRACACIRPGRVRRSAPLRPICSTTAAAAVPAPGTDKAASSSGSGSSSGAVEKEQQHAWDVAGAVVRPAFRARPWDYQEEGQQQQQQGSVPSGKMAAAGTTALPRTKVRQVGNIIRALRVGGVIAFCSAAQRAPRVARACMAASCAYGTGRWAQAALQGRQAHGSMPCECACTAAWKSTVCDTVILFTGKQGHAASRIACSCLGSLPWEMGR